MSAFTDDASCPDCGMPTVDGQHWMFGIGFRQPADCPRLPESVYPAPPGAANVAMEEVMPNE